MRIVIPHAPPHLQGSVFDRFAKRVELAKIFKS
jgi:hypothetical protein